MCGIAGIATSEGLRASDLGLVHSMLGTLSHRGPDDQHAILADRAIVGARRLSIIDLEGGRQPLTDESGQIIATQNGEIYNYLELREELQRKGHRFATDGDTEVLVHLYEDEGPDLVRRLRGMFAIAIWDDQRSRLVLARDRLGKKPLYWRLQEDRLTYGSELKALMVDPDLERVVDRAALELYLQYLYVPSPRTILQGVHKLPPASTLVWEGGDPRIERYWEPSYEPKRARSLADDIEEGLEIIRTAVRLRLRSDVPVGVFLSGGMDSSVVTAVMAELSPRSVKTYSIGFEEQAYNELPYARAVARHLGTEHVDDVVRIDITSMLPDLAYHFDEPFGDSSAVPTFRVSQMASQHVKVVLTGDGGDESFGGYHRYQTQLKLARLDIVPRTFLRGTARLAQRLMAPAAAASRLRGRMSRLEAYSSLGADERYELQMTIIGAADREAALRADGHSRSDGYLLGILQSGPTDPIDRIMRADLLSYLPEDLLVKIDRASMANSLEARAPLLDHELVEFAASLPAARKVDRSTTKVLLRQIAKRVLPAHLVDRRKMGFGVPIDDWFRGRLAETFRDLVLAPDALSRDHMDVSVAAKLLDDHLSGGSHEHRLWTLLMFELWAREWLVGQGNAASPHDRSTRVAAVAANEIHPGGSRP